MTWASKAEKLLPRRAPPSIPPPPPLNRYYHNNHTRTSSAPQFHHQQKPPFDSPASPVSSNGVISYPSSTVYTLDETPEPRQSDTSEPPNITITLPTPAPTPAPPEVQSPLSRSGSMFPKATKIDFAAANLPCYRNHYAAVIDNLFTPRECGQLLELAEQYAAENASPGTPLSGIWSPALMLGNNNNNRRRPADAPSDVTVRKCSRIVMDCETLSEQIFYKLLPYLQEISEVTKVKVKRGRTVAPGPRSYARVRLKGMHSKLKFLKYHPGDHFKPHTDGMYISEDRTQASYYSLIIFLVAPASSSSTADPLTDGEYPGGGCTRIWEDKNQWPLNPVTGVRDRPSGWKPRFLDIEPIQGRVLVFEQNGLRHSGEEVTTGVKYVFKADLLHGEIDGGGGRPWEGP